MGLGARYDAIAHEYEGFVGDGPGLTLPLLPTDLTGQRVIDFACGQGRTCRYLAAQGASPVGVDISADLLAIARGREEAHPLGITYLQSAAESLEWWDGEMFDGAVCDMALMDFDDLGRALNNLGQVVRPGGWLAVSLFHPCCPGTTGPPSWSPDGYHVERRWDCEHASGVRGAVGAVHRKLSTYVNTLIVAGFQIERVEEPEFAQVPVVLLLGCRRTGEAL